MATSSIKEEKIDIKKGTLDMPGEKWIDNFKSWKRYFVFSQIRRGDSTWLKLFYYKNSTCYKEGKMPKDFIDITNASNIGMMDKDIGGKDHIISITVPGKTYYLSASSCDDRSQWLLALRAYKYNDESKLPSTPDRTYSWHGRGSSYSEQVSRKISEPVRANSMASTARIEKFKDKFMVCLKCKGIDVPREVYEWVRPESSVIYNTIYEQHKTSYAPQPPNEPDSNSERIYDEVRYQEQDTCIMIKRKPLPSENNTTECTTSASRAGSFGTSIEHSIPNMIFDKTVVDVEKAVSDDEGGNSPCTNGDGEYIEMSGGKDCIGNDNPPLSMSSSLDAIRISDDQDLGRNQKLSTTSSTGAFHNEFLSKKTSLPEDIPNYVEFNRYSPDPLARRSANSFMTRRENRQSNNGIIRLMESAIPSSVSIPSGEQNSISDVDKETLKLRVNIIDPVFIANI